MQGYNDDLVMPFAIGMFLRETSLKFKKTMEDLTHSSLNNFQKTGDGFQVYSPINMPYDMWKMEVPSANGSQQENLNWLI